MASRVAQIFVVYLPLLALGRALTLDDLPCPLLGFVERSAFNKLEPYGNNTMGGEPHNATRALGPKPDPACFFYVPLVEPIASQLSRLEDHLGYFIFGQERAAA